MTAPDQAACPACAQAERDSLSGAFRSGCDECRARLLARSPAYWAAAMASTLTPRYRDALVASFGPRWLEMHQRVKRWAELAERAGAGVVSAGLP